MARTRVYQILLTCSNCGKHARLENRYVDDTVKFIKSGWGSCGSAIYCPECTATWSERNGDRPMGDEKNTFFVVMREFMKQGRSGGGDRGQI